MNYTINIKKLFLGMLVGIILLFSGKCTQLIVKAENVDTLEAGKTYEFSFSGDETKHLRFIMPEKGYFYYEIMPISYTNEEGEVKNSIGDFGFYIEDIRMTVNYKEYEHESDTWAGKGMKSDLYAFKKGTKIDITLADHILFSEKETIQFRIKITVKKPKNFEKENNNTKSKANKIKKGKNYTGLLMKSDTDYFVFTAPKTKTYKINAVVTSNNGDLHAQVMKGKKVLKTTSARYGEGYVNLYKGKLKKGQKIYIKIYDINSFFYSKSALYQIKVK